MIAPNAPTASSTRFIVGKSIGTERSLGRMRSSRNFNIGPSPAFASSIALRTSSTSSSLSRAWATNVALFLEPGLRPPLPFSKGRPRRGEFGWGRPSVWGFSVLTSHSSTYAQHEISGYYILICKLVKDIKICIFCYIYMLYIRAKHAYLRGQRLRHGSVYWGSSPKASSKGILESSSDLDLPRAPPGTASITWQRMAERPLIF